MLAAINMAHSFKLYGLGAIVLLLFSCKHQESKPLSNVINDTTEVLRVLLDTAVNQGALFDKEKLKSYPLFTDTIVFETNPSLTLNIIDAIRGKKYKALTEEQICSLVSANFNHKSTDTYQMNYLKIKRFFKIKGAYFVELHNALLTPPQYMADLHPENTACITHDAFNSGIIMLFTRKGQSFEGKITENWEAFPTAANSSFQK